MDDKKQMNYDTLCYIIFIKIRGITKHSKYIGFYNIDPTNEEHLLVLAVANACRGILGERDFAVDCNFLERNYLSKMFGVPFHKQKGNHDDVVNVGKLIEGLRNYAKEKCGEDFTFADIYHEYYTEEHAQ